MPFDFSTDQSKNYLQTINQNAPDASAALKVLSLNLPNFLGGSPIAPDALLRPGLSTAAQVGGTASPVPAPLASAVSSQLGTAPVPPPPTTPTPGPIAPAAPAPASPTAVSPFSTAPIAAMATNALAPSTSAPGTPSFQVPLVPTNRPDVTTGNADPMQSLLAALLNNFSPDANSGPAQI